MNVVDKFKTWFSSNAESLLGPSWRTTLAGYGQFFLVCVYHGYTALNGQPIGLKDAIQVLVSAIFAVGLKYAKDKHDINVPPEVVEEAKNKVISVLAGPVAPPEANPEGFEAIGSSAPIRGKFSITADKLASLCVGQFAPYKQYAAAIVENGLKYGINPLFVLADLVNQGVNPAYNNPWGISTDNYPYGFHGEQLGQSNGHVKNGPRKFSVDEWRIAFDRQFAVVATGRAYSNAKTIAGWALIDAPPGAENDVHGTNGEEGAEVGALYNKLVKAL